MANINPNPAFMALPSSIKRGAASPLDTTSVWYTREEMENYAANGATAYVGQILTLVDSDDVAAYVIMNEEGLLQEIGSAAPCDNKTLALDSEGTLSLKNWGKSYYKWIAAQGEEGDPDYVAGHHELFVLGETDTWPAGLQPKAAIGAGGAVELAWYEPSDITVEGINNIVSTLQTSVESLVDSIGTSEDEVESGTVWGAINDIIEDLENKLSLEGGELSGNLILADGSSAASEDVVDAKIATAIGSAGHLKREIIDGLPDVEDADPDTIYMIKSLTATGADKYVEYMLIGDDFEQIGDTSVDLSGYMRKFGDANAAGKVAMFSADGSLANTNVDGYALMNHIANGADIHVTADDKALWNEAAAKDHVTEIDRTFLNNALPIFLTGDGLEHNGTTLSAVHATEDTYGVVKTSATSPISVDANGHLTLDLFSGGPLTLVDNKLAIYEASAHNAGVMTAAQFTKLSNIEEDAQKNVVEGALLGTEDYVATINENKKLVIPFAGVDTPGVFIAEGEDNGIWVDPETGIAEITDVTVDRLKIPYGDELVLFGGHANF